MAPEVYEAQVLPDPDYGSENVICSPQNRGALKLLFYKVFTKLNS
jgi:hypothetical protein